MPPLPAFKSSNTSCFCVCVCSEYTVARSVVDTLKKRQEEYRAQRDVSVDTELCLLLAVDAESLQQNITFHIYVEGSDFGFLNKASYGLTLLRFCDLL
jgi:hypothetical protein